MLAMGSPDKRASFSPTQKPFRAARQGLKGEAGIKDTLFLLLRLTMEAFSSFFGFLL